MSSFQLRHRTFQRFAIRMTGPRVVVTLVLSQFFIHVSGCLIDGRDDCSRRGIRLLAHMNGIRGKAHVALLAFLHFCEADSLELAADRPRALPSVQLSQCCVRSRFLKTYRSLTSPSIRLPRKFSRICSERNTEIGRAHV